MINQNKRKLALIILIMIFLSLIGSILDGIININNNNYFNNLNEQEKEILFYDFNIDIKKHNFNITPLGDPSISVHFKEEMKPNKTPPLIVGIPNKNSILFKSLSQEDWEILYRVARCEAGGWCETYTECGQCSKCKIAKEGQQNVIYVILNRLNDKRFPNTIKEIVFSESQFKVTKLDLFYSIEITEYCKQNVQEAIKMYQKGKSANGAIYFNSKGAYYWSWAKFLFKDAVGHYFYK